MSKNKAKGTSWETEIVTFLNRTGLRRKVYRPAQAGARDTGDIHGLPHFAIQAKNWKNIANAVREGVKGVEIQRMNLGVPFGVAFIKKPYAPTKHCYAVMRMDNYMELLRRAMPEAFVEEEKNEAD